MAVNVVFLAALLAILDPTLDVGSLPSGDRSALVLLLFEVHAYGVHVGQVLFGFSLVLLGLVVRRSAMVPEVLGTLAALAGAGYLADSVANLVVPAAADATSVVVVVLALAGELPLFVWLLFRGVVVPQPISPTEGWTR
jgi:hypothetical protein